jgi:acetyl esterase/lipase
MKKLILFNCLLLVMATITSAQQNVPLQKEDITVWKDVVYAVIDGYELKLDIAVPKYLKSPAPAIVDIPGGAWRVVNKSVDDALFYAQYGFVGVSITHRTSDIAPFPAAVHDCKTVIRWLRAHAKQYQINPNRIGVSGFSSGGHLAALLGTSGGDSYLEGKGGNGDYSSSVQAVVDHFGPTDFLKMHDKDAPDSPPSLFLGGPVKEKADLARLANPLNYIDPKDPPVFILHGENDSMVTINQSEIFYEALKKAGVPAKFVRVINAAHMYRPYKWNIEISPTVDSLYEMIIPWFEEWLGKPELDTARIQPRKPRQEIASGKKIPFSYRLTFEFPDEITRGTCVGRFLVKTEEKVLYSGNIQIDDLSSKDKPLFVQKFEIEDAGLDGKEIMWNFRGEINISLSDESIPVMLMRGEKYDPEMEGVGYHFRIKKDLNVDVEKKVYRKTIEVLRQKE